MELVKAETYEKYRRVLRNLWDFTSLTERAELTAEAQALIEECERLDKDGISEVMFFGKLRSGTSTLINALVGLRLFGTTLTHTTVFNTVVEQGNKEDLVDVIFDDGFIRKVSNQGFIDTFMLHYKEMEDFAAIKRFTHIDRAVTYCQNPVLSNDLHLIDTVALDYLDEDTAQRNRFEGLLSEADAIVFVLNAISLFSNEEKEFIENSFAGKHLRNVFFVVNRIDNLTNDELEESVKPAVRTGLEEVFLDENGDFNEALYNKRVFFTNAYGALCLKTDTPYTPYMFAGRRLEIKIGYDETGMPEFEAALSEYLNLEERVGSVLAPVLRPMASAYVSMLLHNSHPDDLLKKRSRNEIFGKMQEIFLNTFEEINGSRPTEVEILKLCRDA